MNKTKIILALAILGLVVAFLAFDLGHLLSLDYFKTRQQDFNAYYQAHRFVAVGIYMGIYILVTALSLPGAAVMTLAGGALFGFWTALVTVSFASSIGAFLAFLASRFLFRDYVQGRFGEKLKTINTRLAREGAFYLFTLRLVPIFPFFVINLVMGITPIRALSFYWVSQVGMLPGTAVFVNAGAQLGQLTSLRGIMSPGLLISFALLGIFPLIAKKAVNMIKARKSLAGYAKPRQFDYNLVVIGAGSAGLVSAYIAATVRAKVALIEKNKMGGDCLNTGCVPSKALLRSARMLAYARRATEFGFKQTDVTYDFANVMHRVREVIRKVEPHDSTERYTRLGVECIQGEARIRSPYEVEVNGRILTTRGIIIASGGRPFIPPIKGLNEIPYLTSDTVWNLNALPRRMVVLGGGPIGCEMTQAFARFGSEVTQVEMMPQIMGREDPDVAGFIRKTFEAEGVRVLTDHKALEVVNENGQKALICEHKGEKIVIGFDEILVAVGRVAHARGFGLEELGVEITPRGTIATDAFLRTNFPNIYCAGDVAGPYQFTHTAAHQAWYAAVNALFSGIKQFRADYRVIPWCTFTDPEVARVGLNERDAVEQKISFEKTVFGINDLDRAIADSEDRGFVKVLTRPGSDRILGVTIVGAHAGDILAEYVLAMKQGIGLNKILGTIHVYPTLAEANKYAAGEWKRAHAPERILRLIKRYHDWRRG